MTVTTKLEKRGVIEVLLYLREKGKASRTDLRDNVEPVLETIYKTTLPTLKRLSLIQEKKKRKFPFTVEIFLTEKGKKVAEKLSEIEGLLK